jgi:hypothetical protein
VGGIGAFLVGWQGAAYQMPRPLHVEAKYLDIGEQWEQENFKWVLPVRNMRDEPVEVTSIGSSCTCTSIEPQSFVVPPGETVFAQLTLNLTQRVASSLSSHTDGTRAMQVVLTPIIRGGSPVAIRWHLTGTIRPLLHDLPAALEFPKGAARLGTTPAHRDIQIRSVVPLQRLVATCNPRVCEAQLVAESNSPREFILRLTPKCDGRTGYRDCNLILLAYGNAPTALAERSVPVGVWFTSDVDTLPNEFAFGPILVGTSASQTVEFISQSGTTYEILELNLEGVTGAITTIRPGHAYQLSVTCEVEGDQTGVLRAQIKPSIGGETFELVKPVTYFGTPARPTYGEASRSISSLERNHAP